MSERDKVKTCPRCNKEYTGYPALSRVGLGDICPACGQRETFEAVGMSPEKVEELVAEIQERTAAVQAEVDAVNAGLKAKSMTTTPWGKYDD